MIGILLTSVVVFIDYRFIVEISVPSYGVKKFDLKVENNSDRGGKLYQFLRLFSHRHFAQFVLKLGFFLPFMLSFS